MKIGRNTLGRIGVKSVVTALISALGITSAVLGVREWIEHHPTDLSGEWRIANTITRTTHAPFQGMTLEYRVFFHQTDHAISAPGEKFSENGRSLRPFERTPITFNGTLSGSRLAGTFTEQGALRATSGRFSWRLVSSKRELVGEFSSTAANASGSSRARKR